MQNHKYYILNIITHFSSVSKLCVLVNTTSGSVLSLFDMVGDLIFLSFSSSPIYIYI